MGSEYKDETNVDFLARRIVIGMDEAAERIVEAIQGLNKAPMTSFEQLMEMTPDARIKLAGQLCEGTSHQVTVR